MEALSDPQNPWPYDDEADRAEAVRNEKEVVPPPANMPELTEAHVRQAMLRSMLWVGIFGFAIGSVLLLIYGWQTALMLLIGAAIAAASLWEWHRLILIVSAKLEGGKKGGGMRIAVGFFLRLIIAGAVIYGSLKCLHGSVFALMGGLALAVPSLGLEAGRLVRTSTRASG